MKDYYKTLGVEKNASKDDIKKAFRKLAHENHPDKNANNPSAAQKFKEASEAYSVLSDDAKRKQYDTFGSAGMGTGAPGGNPFQGGFNTGQGFGGFDFSQFQQGGFHFNQNGVEFDLGEIIGEFFGGGRGARGRRPRKGANITVDVQLTFKESIFGTEKDIAINGERLTLKIPPGVESGQGLRIADRGEPGQPPANDPKGPVGPRGDLIVRLWAGKHPTLRKEAFNLIVELPIKLTTAIAGGTISIETLDGAIDLKIPTGTTHGEILQVKGKGVPYEANAGGIFSSKSRRGDLLVVTQVIMPKKLSKNAQRLIEELGKEGL